MNKELFAEKILIWFKDNGRHDLPWQINRTAYSAWVAEIMLQQTQVETVTPYYKKFIQRFPNIEKLAASSLDDVLALWSGLGYYARARNLYETAQVIHTVYNDIFPENYDDIISLPGIGRSTAGAILSQVFNKPFAILDGNVKRVLARFYAIEGWSGKSSVLAALWEKAEIHTPQKRAGEYAQAMMDLGSIVCTRSNPSCELCPLVHDCKAYAQNGVELYPASKPKKTKPVKTVKMLLLANCEGHVLLEKRPPTGIWGGLWSLPEVELDTDVIGICEQRWGFIVDKFSDFAVIRHTFSHYHLDITPCEIQVDTVSNQIADSGYTYIWCNKSERHSYGLAAPVTRLLQQRFTT